MLSSPDMCTRCDGLCCRVYDIFDPKSGKHVKKAGEKCGYLDIKNRCRIYNKWGGHLGFEDACGLYDCHEAGPVVTLFSRRIPDDFPKKYAVISSLLETIRITIEERSDKKEKILDYAAKLLNGVRIDESLSISVKVVRVKIEQSSYTE